jgi:2-dehydropantoate 2-reductase
MHIAILGAGGVGGFLGARLASGGADVAFLARGAHLAAMRERGLSIEGAQPLHLPRVNVAEDPAAIGPVDLVVFSVKLWDSAAALERIGPLLGSGTAVVSFQNGVTKDDDLRRALDPARILGGVVYISAVIDRPGVIRQVGPNHRFLFGEIDGSRSARGEALLEACRKGGVRAELSPDIHSEIWKKFVFLVGLSGTTTAIRVPIGAIRENRQTRELLVDVMREVVAVGRARGVALGPAYAEECLAFIDTLPSDMTSSMHQDLLRGGRLEVGWLAGAVVELGRAVGVATPLNRAIADVLALHAGGGTGK